MTARTPDEIWSSGRRETDRSHWPFHGATTDAARVQAARDAMNDPMRPIDAENELERIERVWKTLHPPTRRQRIAAWFRRLRAHLKREPT